MSERKHHYFVTLRADGSGRPQQLFSFDHPQETLEAQEISKAEHDDCVANFHTRAWIDGAMVEVESDQVHSLPLHVVVDRLIIAGQLRPLYAAMKLEAPAADLTDAEFNVRERWKGGGPIASNDPAITALLTEIGADPGEILAGTP